MESGTSSDERDGSVVTSYITLAIFALALCYVIWRNRNAITRFVSDIVTPFATIARELRRANELKELEMAERINPFNGKVEPIIVLTEAPGRNDTEIFFGIEEEGKTTLKDRLVAQLTREALDDGE